MNVDIRLTPDELVLFSIGPLDFNATIVYSWGVMALLVLASFLITRNLSTGKEISRWQNAMEAIVATMHRQIGEMTRQDPRPYLPFLATLFLFISVSNLLSPLPLYSSPMGSLSSTAALAGCVFLAVPIFGIMRRGLGGYLRHFISPSPVMLPFNIIGELSRTLALAVRLFGNVMSTGLVAAILLAIAPFFFPVVMQVLDLIIGQIQAYIFAALATIYIASAVRKEQRQEGE
jgi:F-type H+-transporting ATPase subunit a